MINTLMQDLKETQEKLANAINESAAARQDMRHIIDEVAKIMLPENPWQPIATAPKDGSEILVKVSGQNTYLVVAWDDVVIAWGDGDKSFTTHPWSTLDGPNYHADTFSHWMRIPELSP